MSTEIHYRTFEDYYYESERQNREHLVELEKLKREIADRDKQIGKLLGKLDEIAGIIIHK